MRSYLMFGLGLEVQSAMALAMREGRDVPVVPANDTVAIPSAPLVSEVEPKDVPPMELKGQTVGNSFATIRRYNRDRLLLNKARKPRRR